MRASTCVLVLMAVCAVVVVAMVVGVHGTEAGDGRGVGAAAAAQGGGLAELLRQQELASQGAPDAMRVARRGGGLPGASAMLINAGANTAGNCEEQE